MKYEPNTKHSVKTQNYLFIYLIHFLKFSPRHEAHKAATFFFHSARSFARPRTSFQLLHPSRPLSFSTVRLQVVFGATYSAFPLWLPSHCHHTIIISLFPEYMADPIPASSSEFIAYLVDPRNLFNFLIAYFLRPSYSEDPSEACELKAVHLVLLCLCYFPCFTTIEQHWAYKCLE